MHRRRGLVSKATENTTSGTSSPRRRVIRADSLDSDLSSSESSGFSSSASADDQRPAEERPEHPDKIETELNDKVNLIQGNEPPREISKRLKGKKRQKRDISEEDRWQKIKLKGSEKEILVDKTRIQKYVDFDSTGVASFQAEVKEIKGNFRQTLADYSDL
jgi:hypothetical protein